MSDGEHDSEPLEDGEIHYYPSDSKPMLNMQSLGFSFASAPAPAPAPSREPVQSAEPVAPREPRDPRERRIDPDIKVIEVKSRQASQEANNPEEKKKDVANWTANTVLTFGKYRGETVGNVPVGYLRWLAGYVWDEGRRTFLHQPAKPSFYGQQAFRYFHIHRLCLGCGQVLPPDEIRLLHRQCFEKQLLRDEPRGRGSGSSSGEYRSRGKYRGNYRSRPY